MPRLTFRTGRCGRDGRRNCVGLSIRVEDAPALCVYFDAFHLPMGSPLTFQSEAGRFSSPYVEGPIDYTENNDHGQWVSGEVPGKSW